jgi:hypothetical protein
MDLIAEICSRDLRKFLEGEGHSFKGNTTLCPFHDDHQPSMSVDEKNGSWLWYCHRCQEGGNIITYYTKKHNVSKKESVEKLAGIFGLKSVNEKPVVVAEYPYFDEQGKELFKVVRFKPKDFRVKHEVNGQWLWDKKGIREVLYNLPQIIKAEEVWLVEGEKDADNVQKLGLVATTAPFGMGHWKSEFSETLKGKTVNVSMDRGAEEEAERRARDIARVAKKVRIIELPGLAKEGEDVSDWIEHHDSQDAESLKAMLEKIAMETLVYVPPVILKSSELSIENEFLNTYIDSISRVTDAPKIFILFSGLGLLSGLLNQFYFSYPRRTPLNLYILLLAPSTVFRKSVCLDITTDYINSVDPEIPFPESFSSEALLEILTKKSHGLVIWRELIQVKEFQFGSDYNKGLPSLLTDLYDYKEKYKRWTKGEGETIIENPTLTILAAGISSWLVDDLRRKDFQGGIWSRFLFVPVTEDERHEAFKLPRQFITNPVIEEKLKALHALDPRKMNLENIYPLLQRWGEKHFKQSQKIENILLQANFQRLEVALIKIACLLQLAENGSTIVEEASFNEAMKIIEFLKMRLPGFFEEEVYFNEVDRARVLIQKFLKRKGRSIKGAILRGTKVGSDLADKIFKQLLAEGHIKAIRIPTTEKGGRPGMFYEWISNDE